MGEGKCQAIVSRNGSPEMVVKAGLTVRQENLAVENQPKKVKAKDHTLPADLQKHNATHRRVRKKDPQEFHGKRKLKKEENKMPNVRGKKFPYTKKGKAAAKAYKAKKPVAKKPMGRKKY